MTSEAECKQILASIRNLRSEFGKWVRVEFGVWQRLSDGLCYVRENGPISTYERTERVPYGGSHLHHSAANFAAYGDEQCTIEVKKGQKYFEWALTKVPPRVLTGAEVACRLPGPIETMLEANNGIFVDHFSCRQGH